MEMKGSGFMYAISFDLKVDELKQYYGEPYNQAYYELQKELSALGFEWVQGSVYINTENVNGIAHIYRVIEKLSSIEWFKESVRDIRAFKVEDWSDMTDIVKG